MFSSVSGRQSPLRRSGPQPRVRTRTSPGSSMFRWLCTIPFGTPVVPLVKAIPAGASWLGLAPPAGRARPRTRRAHSAVPTTVPPRAWLRGPARISDGAARSASACCSSGAKASLMPTQIAPMRWAPWKATTTSRSFGRQAATRSPGRTPSCHMAPAAADAAWSSSA